MQLKEVYMDGVNSMYENSAGKKKTIPNIKLINSFKKKTVF